VSGVAVDGEARIRAEVDRTREEVTETRRALHRHPELSLQERDTAVLVAERSADLGFTVRRGVGGTGVIADLDSGKPGPTLMLRADMDALPITERGEGRVVTSEVDGVMHACGHDGHSGRPSRPGELLSSLASSSEAPTASRSRSRVGAATAACRTLRLTPW
jgi:hypothetical protein